MRTRIIALANQKGGVGKTTTLINLATCLAQRKFQVLAVDLDPQCNATSGLGVPQEAGASAYRVLLGEGSLADKIRETRVKNLSIVPAEVDLAGAEIDVPRADRYLLRFRDAIQPVVQQDRFDYILVDCPPSLGILTMNALAAADSVIIPTQCEYYALEGLAVICRLIDQTRNGGANRGLEMDGIVMTMFDGRTHLSGEVVDEVRRHFGDKVYDTVIPRNVRLSEAPSYGMAAVEYDASCTGAKAYRKMADEFIKRDRARRAGMHPAPAQKPPAPQSPVPQPEAAPPDAAETRPGTAQEGLPPARQEKVQDPGPGIERPA